MYFRSWILWSVSFQCICGCLQKKHDEPLEEIQTHTARS